MLWNDRQRLYAVAQGVRGVGWLLAFLILVLGTVMAAKGHAQVALLTRVLVAGAVVATTSAIAWLISRFAER